MVVNTVDLLVLVVMVEFLDVGQGLNGAGVVGQGFLFLTVGGTVDELGFENAPDLILTVGVLLVV